MGCDIHSFAEVKRKNKWEKVGDYFMLDTWSRKYFKKDKGEEPFSNRNYSLFAFLANVRNYDHCEPISETKGFPRDASKEVKEHYENSIGYSHSVSNLSLKELLDFDYEKEFWNRRVSKQTGPNSWTGAGVAEEGEGEIITYRENLGENYFSVLEELKELGEPDDVRIVFWFDN